MHTIFWSPTISLVQIGDKSLGHAVKLNMYLAFHRDSSSSLFRNEQSADFLLQQEKGA